MLLEIVSLISALAILFWLFIKNRYRYWERCGIASVPAEFPFGSVKECLLTKKTVGETLAGFYQKHQDKKLIGFYAPLQPMILIRDPELIKTVLVKDFNSFCDNGFELSEKIDPLLGYNPFGVKGLQEWKQIRSFHTPLHSMVKIKSMVPQMIKIGMNFAKYIENNLGKSIEMKQLARLYTNDVVGSCAFGVESDSFFDENSPLKIYTTGELFGVESEANYACLSAFFLPFVNNIFRWRTMSKKVEDFFIEMAKSCMNHRNESGLIRQDMIQLLIAYNNKALQENMKQFSDQELAANCMTFFIDGVETTSVALSFALFEIALNTIVQNKLRDEIKTAVKDISELDFDKLWSLQYLDMVVVEALRKYPPVNLLSRLCVQEILMDGVKVKPGTKVFIPVHGIHRDPKYYPEPEHFLPERFTKEKRSQMNKFTYLPFGEGPRTCLGNKFAQTEMKVALVALISKFHLQLSKENEYGRSLELDEKSVFLIAPKGGVNIIFTPV
ncbi:cytochrome P450 6k1-like [Rhodnius prolixus]